MQLIDHKRGDMHADFACDTRVVRCAMARPTTQSTTILALGYDVVSIRGAAWIGQLFQLGWDSAVKPWALFFGTICRIIILVLMASQQAAKWLPGDGIIQVHQPIAVYSSMHCRQPCQCSL